MSNHSENILVEMKSITKTFPGVVANDNASVTVKAGEIHALLGENGAGKSTLMNVLTGLYRPDSGGILVKGNPAHFSSPRDAMNAGIAMVHQHFKLVQPFTVAENIILGSKKQGFFLDYRKINQEITGLSESYGLHIDPKARIWQLSVGEQQRVEIVKMLYRGAEILILDEPTAVLTPQEVKELFATLQKMAAKGRGIIIITHKLQEVLGYADRITVLRDGRTVATVDKEHTNEEELTRFMVGREITLKIEKTPVKEGKTILRLSGLGALNDKGFPALRGINLTIKSGEIVGIAGVAGNGQRELAEAIAGLRPVTSGEVFIDGGDLTGRRPQEIITAGVSYIPEDRLGMGLVPGLGAVENVILKDYRHMSKGMFLALGKARDRARQLVERFEVKTPNLNYPVKLLSGGNLQRLLLAREISANPKLIIALYPARGLDIGATATVYKMLLAQRERGAAILLVSEDLDELFNISDRIAVLYDGQIMGVMPTQKTNIEEVGYMMVGARKEEEAVG